MADLKFLTDGHDRLFGESINAIPTIDQEEVLVKVAEMGKSAVAPGKACFGAWVTGLSQCWSVLLWWSTSAYFRKAIKGHCLPCPPLHLNFKAFLSIHWPLVPLCTGIEMAALTKRRYRSVPKCLMLYVVLDQLPIMHNAFMMIRINSATFLHIA